MSIIINKKGLSTVIATILLLLVSVALFSIYSNWHRSFIAQKAIEYETIGQEEIKFVKFDGGTLSIRSYSNTDLIYDTIFIGDKDCNVNGTIERKSFKQINLGICAQDMNKELKLIKIKSKQGYFLQEMLLTTTINGILTVLFEPSSNCPDITYTKLYAMSSLDNAHAQIPSQTSYTYSVCIKSPYINFGTSCSGTHTTLFYLSNISDSHVYIDNNSAATAPIPNYYNWQELCLSSTQASTITTTVASSSPGAEYACIGSVDQDDYNGGMIGDCSKYDDKIWVYVE